MKQWKPLYISSTDNNETNSYNVSLYTSVVRITMKHCKPLYISSKDNNDNVSIYTSV